MCDPHVTMSCRGLTPRVGIFGRRPCARPQAPPTWLAAENWRSRQLVCRAAETRIDTKRHGSHGAGAAAGKKSPALLSPGRSSVEVCSRPRR